MFKKVLALVLVVMLATACTPAGPSVYGENPVNVDSSSGPIIAYGDIEATNDVLFEKAANILEEVYNDCGNPGFSVSDSEGWFHYFRDMWTELGIIPYPEPKNLDEITPSSNTYLEVQFVHHKDEASEVGCPILFIGLVEPELYVVYRNKQGLVRTIDYSFDLPSWPR